MSKNLGNLFISAENDIIDELNNHSVLDNHTVVRNSTNKKYGSYSLYFNGSSYVQFSSSNYLDIGTGDFTIDCWVRRIDIMRTETIFSINNYIGNDTSNGLIVLGGTNTFSMPYFGLIDEDGKGYSLPVIATGWFHLAVTRQSGMRHFFIDGVKQQQLPNCTANIQSESNGITLGSFGGTYANKLYGYIDNFRVIKGQALWTENFSLTDEVLCYINPNVNPNRPDNVRGLYNSSLKAGIRNAARNGFVRPTVAEMFISSKDFVEIPAIEPINPISLVLQSGSTAVLSNNNLTSTNMFANWHGGVVDIPKSTGKWYLEFIQPDSVMFSVGVKDSTNTAQNHYAAFPSLSYLANNVYQGAMGGPACPTAPAAGTIMAVAYDIENHNFKVYANGELFFNYEANPSYYLTGSILFFVGTVNIAITINTTPTYEISGYKYIN